MALIQCPDCSCVFSGNQPACPNCRRPVDALEPASAPDAAPAPVSAPFPASEPSADESLVRCAECSCMFSKDQPACPNCRRPVTSVEPVDVPDVEVMMICVPKAFLAE